LEGIPPAVLSNKLGHRVDGSSLHELAQALGQRAEQEVQHRLKQLPPEQEPRRADSALAVLMLDGNFWAR
jgi:hypothetical protein